MTTRVALILVVAACGGGAAPPAAPAHTAATPPEVTLPAPAYAGLFVDGASYRYRVEWSTERDDVVAVADPTGKLVRAGEVEITCTVGAVGEQGNSLRSTVTCDVEDIEPIRAATASPAGPYVAAEQGLWHTWEPYELAAEEMILPAQPAPSSWKHEDPEGSYHLAVDITRRADGAWCWHGRLEGPDVHDATRCFADGLLVDGGVRATGSLTYDVRYTLIR